jgi:hypothetical protein
VRKTPSAFLVALSVLCLLGIFSLAARAQDRDRDDGRENGREQEHPNGIIEDWSHHHAVYPRVGPIQSLIAVQHDPRALHSWQNSMRKDWRRYNRRHFGHGANTAVHTDWSISLGGGTVAPAMYPAKFTFDTGAAPNCATDFVVFPVNIAGSAIQPNIAAFNNLYSGTVPANGICNRAVPPAGDNGTSATTIWSYDITAGGGIVSTSPSLSLDGTKVAFVETGSGATHFHVLAWKSGDGVDVTTPSAQNVLKPKVITSGFALLAPAAGSGTVTDLPLGSTTDTLSSPFVDYVKDVAYVGNDSGILFRIKNVFCTLSCTVGVTGAPSLDATWNGTGSVTTGCGGVLTGAVVANTGNVFVGCSDGRVYGFTTAGVALSPTDSILVGNGSATGGIVDTPIVDSVNGLIYAVSGNSAGGTEVVVQASAADLGSVQTATLAAGGNHNLHAPALNDAYYTSGSALNWRLYEVAGDSVAGGIKLYGITFAGSHVMTSGNPGSVDSFAVGGAFEISPLTEFLTTGGEDRFFESFLAAGGGSLASFRIDTGFPATFETTNSANVGTGTTGIIIDNAASSSSQADSVYFGALGANTAVKLTQASLQ